MIILNGKEIIVCQIFLIFVERIIKFENAICSGNHYKT